MRVAKLASLPIERPVATSMLLVGLTVLGLVAVDRLPLDFLPLIKKPALEVTVPYPGSHPHETLREVLRPLEEEVAAIPGVASLEGTASPGRVQLDVEFAWGTDVNLKRLEVREAVERAQDRFPKGIGRVQVKGKTDGIAGGAILQGRISATRDLATSWDLLERRIKRPLERVRGVAHVDLYGVEPQRVQVDIDMGALTSHGLHAGRVLEVLEAANLDLDLGAVRSSSARHDARFVGRFRSLAEVRALPVRRGIRIADVARVSLRAPRLDYGRHLDQKFAIGIDVHKEPSANTVETVDRLHARVRQLERDPQLEGVKLLVWSDAGAEIRRSLGGLRNAGLWGGLLAVVVLFGFLRRLRTTLIVAVAIPFSLLVTCGAMFLLGSRFDVLTLLGLMLGVGMLVDNAVVVIENIHRLQAEGLEPRQAAREGVRGVFLAVVASTATTLIVWSWLFVAQRSPLTIYMGSVALTICLAVACSLLISVTFIPLAAARFVPGEPTPLGPLLRRLVPGYRWLLERTLNHRGKTLLALIALAASAYYPIQAIEKTGQPRMRERAVSIRYEVHGPASKETLEGFVDKVEAWVAGQQQQLGYESMYSWYSERRGTLTMVYLHQAEATDANLDRMRETLRGSLPQMPGVTLSIGDRMWWQRGGSGKTRRVAVALHGDEPESLQELAGRVVRHLETLPGVTEVAGPEERGRREVLVKVDPEKAHAVGLSPWAAGEAVGFAYRGRVLRRYQGARGEVEMLLGIPAASRPGLSSLRGLPIPRLGRAAVPLSALASVHVLRVPSSVRRDDRRTTQWVSARLADGLTTEEGQARVKAAMAQVPLPDGTTWDFGSWGRKRGRSLETMTKGVALSLLVVILLLIALFESFTQPLAIVITLPLAFFGAFWALWLGGYDLDAVGFIGVIILIGIVVNNGIVMVDHVNALRREGLERREALLLGCGNRLRPVLMTAITTLVGLIPLAVSGSTVAGAYIDSLAVCVIGGLATSTIFTLVALPVWYTAVEDLGALLTRAIPRRAGAPLAFPSGGVLADEPAATLPV